MAAYNARQAQQRAALGAQQAHAQAAHTAARQAAAAPPKGIPAAPAPPKGVPRPGSVGVPATTPAAPAAPQFSPDSGYNDALSLAHRQYLNTIGGLDTAERTTRYDYGFDDPTNPFSRVNDLKRDFLMKGNYIGNLAAASGQLYSGSRQNSLNVNNRNQDESYAALQAAYRAALDQISGQRTGAGNAEEAASLQAFQEAMARQGIH